LRNLARKIGLVATAATAAVTMIAAPAHAATNPYTAASACGQEFGGSWASVSDGHRAIYGYYGNKLGDVYLMYNSATGYNCVTTIKSAYVGEYTFVGAKLTVENGSTVEDYDLYQYYAATKAPARGHCVKYSGSTEDMDAPNDGEYSNGRSTWGNCG
jgi:hypothetical protein